MITKISLIVCLLALIATVIIPITCYGRLSSFYLSDLLSLSFIIGPYLLLGLMAWRWRGDRVVSVIAFLLILTVASGGLYLIGDSCYNYQTDPQYRLYDNYTLPVVILLEWLGTGLLGLVIMVVRLISKRGRKEPPIA